MAKVIAFLKQWTPQEINDVLLGDESHPATPDIDIALGDGRVVNVVRPAPGVDAAAEAARLGLTDFVLVEDTDLPSRRFRFGWSIQGNRVVEDLARCKNHARYLAKRQASERAGVLRAKIEAAEDMDPQEAARLKNQRERLWRDHAAKLARIDAAATVEQLATM